MPDIDSLMQEWPGEVEELLKEISLPTAALQVELSAYVDIICGLYPSYPSSFLPYSLKVFSYLRKKGRKKTGARSYHQSHLPLPPSTNFLPSLLPAVAAAAQTTTVTPLSPVLNLSPLILMPPLTLTPVVVRVFYLVNSHKPLNPSSLTYRQMCTI